VVGLSASEAKAGAPTVRTVGAFIEPVLARMVVFPNKTLVARPELLIVAADDEELHVAVAVRSSTLPSEKAPVAVNC
jgi:hypothetical protein